MSTEPQTDPFALFESWYADARAGEPSLADAMTLATVDAHGQPSARMVLIKGHGPDGFVFYTNYESDKALDLAAVPKAALLFHWKSLGRQIRIEGTVMRTSAAESDAYFATRPRESQLGTWASDQSRPLDTRETFDARFAAAHDRFPGEVPRPPYWGGYRVTPQRIEFWQDRAHRLHERHVFTRLAGGWSQALLYP